MRIRLAKLREWLAGSGADSFLISNPTDRRYLSGFTGSAGFLLISIDKAILATDFRYIEQATQQAPDFEVYRLEPTIAASFADLMKLLGAKRMAFEADDLSYADYQDLRNTVPAEDLELMPAVAVVEKIRAVKDEIELGHMTKAAEIADAAFAHVVSILKPGMTERQVAWELEKTMREMGSEAMPFEVITAAGPRSALPHARPTDRPIQEGEPIVIDWGARYDGYCSDCTRTLVLGEPDETFIKVYNIVLQAQHAAMRAIRPGIAGAEVDAVARNNITDLGYGEYFGHGLGHGVGLVVHELPTLRKTSEDHLVEGNVFSIEPGIYLPGWGGVRIEDLGTIAQGELELLTKAAKIEVTGGKR